MNDFSPSEAALEGFRLTRERPGTVLTWCGVYFTGMLVIAILMMVSLGPDFIALAKKGQFSSEDIDAVGSMLARSGPAFLLVLVLAVALMSVLTSGIYRLVLRPQEPGFAHLRLGPDELRLTAVNLLLFAVGMAFLFLGFVAAAAGEQVSPALGFVLAAAVAAITVWVGVRLSLATPMTFATHRFSIREAWRLTAGRHFWPLLGMIVLAVIFYVMVWLLISIIGLAVVGLAGGDQGGGFSPLAVVAAVATLFMQLILSVLQLVMIYSPFAVAYQELHGDAPARPLRTSDARG
ncbi:MAG: hypothetical protein KGO51_10940 [Alphaproteobacteria bacterium]|nr:hypothetical protein [Alphaproteobacteria bacterium]